MLAEETVVSQEQNEADEELSCPSKKLKLDDFSQCAKLLQSTLDSGQSIEKEGKEALSSLMESVGNYLRPITFKDIQDSFMPRGNRANQLLEFNIVDVVKNRPPELVAFLSGITVRDCLQQVVTAFHMYRRKSSLQHKASKPCTAQDIFMLLVPSRL